MTKKNLPFPKISPLFLHPKGHPEFSINPVFFATCAPLFINASVVIVYRYYRSLRKKKQPYFLCKTSLTTTVWSLYHTLPNPHEQNASKEDLNYISREIMMILQKDDEKRKYCIYDKFPILIYLIYFDIFLYI